MTNVEYHGCLLFQGDRTNKDAEEARNVETAESAGSKKLHANAAKRNSNKFSPKLEEIQEEARKRVVENKKKSSPTFEIPPSLDSGIVTRSVSSHSQSNDDDYNDHSDDESEMTRDNTETEDDEEFLSKSDMKMFGKGRGRQKPSVDEDDIVSDIYSTAFSKVPKVGHDHCVSVSTNLMLILLRSCPVTLRVFTP